MRTPTNKDKRFPPEILSPDEARKLIHAASTHAPTGIRNRSMIAMLYRSGLRIGEFLALMPKDIDRDSGTIRVLHGKGNKARTVGIDDAAMPLLDRWLDRRTALGINPAIRRSFAHYRANR